nr:Chain C, Caspase-9 [synthetic construct]3D9T_D Chain D, Caspase-9 [synthetic construct]
ATPFQE